MSARNDTFHAVHLIDYRPAGGKGGRQRGSFPGMASTVEQVGGRQAAPEVTSGRLVAGVETALILVGVVLLAAGQHHQITSDGRARFEALGQLLDHGRLSANQYSLIGPLFATPLWIAGRLAGHLEGWLSQYNMVVFALGLATMYALLRNRMDRVLLRRFLLLVVAGSMVAPHVTDFYGEVFTAMGVGVGVLAALVRAAAPGTRIAGWAAVALGAANTPASLIGLGLVGGSQALHTRRWRYAVPVLAGALLVLGEAWVRRGNPLHNGYPGTVQIAKTVMPYSGRDGFSYPFLLGILAIVFSFGKGILWYLPGLVLPIRRKLRELHDPAGVDLWRLWLLWTLFLAGLVLAYASWWSWYGGMYWGPRFFLVGVLPASLALAVCLRYERAGLLGNLATLGVLGLAGWIGADSNVFGGLWAWTCYENYYALEALCHFTPEFSALWYPFVARPPVTGGQLLTLGYYAAVFGWLATPVLVRVVGQLADWLALRSSAYLDRTHWRW